MAAGERHRCVARKAYPLRRTGRDAELADGFGNGAFQVQVQVPKLSPPAPFQYKDNIVPIEISEYAGYAGLIAANGGLEPNENSYFFKNHGFKVRLTISEDEDWSELNEGKLAGSVSLSGDQKTVTWTPSGKLVAGTRYQAHVGIADVNGIAMTIFTGFTGSRVRNSGRTTATSSPSTSGISPSSASGIFQMPHSGSPAQFRRPRSRNSGAQSVQAF